MKKIDTPEPRYKRKKSGYAVENITGKKHNFFIAYSFDIV